MKKYCLFEDRHDLPENEGAICSSFDFTINKTHKFPRWFNLLFEGGYLYVTDSPALTEFLKDCIEHGTRSKIILLHYNNNTKEYFEQVFDFS